MAHTSAPSRSHSPRRTGSRRARGRDDDVLLRRVSVALSRLGARRRAERAQLLGGAAVGDNALDRRHGRPDRVDLGLGLPAAADDAEAASAQSARGASRQRRSQLRCAAGRARPPRSQPPASRSAARTDRRRTLLSRLTLCRPSLRRSPARDRRRTSLRKRRRRARVAAAARSRPTPSHPQEARLDHRHRIACGDQALDVALGEIERQAESLRGAQVRSVGQISFGRSSSTETFLSTKQTA